MLAGGLTPEMHGASNSRYPSYSGSSQSTAGRVVVFDDQNQPGKIMSVIGATSPYRVATARVASGSAGSGGANYLAATAEDDFLMVSVNTLTLSLPSLAKMLSTTPPPLHPPTCSLCARLIESSEAQEEHSGMPSEAGIYLRP